MFLAARSQNAVIGIFSATHECELVIGLWNTVCGKLPIKFWKLRSEFIIYYTNRVHVVTKQFLIRRSTALTILQARYNNSWFIKALVASTTRVWRDYESHVRLLRGIKKHERVRSLLKPSRSSYCSRIIDVTGPVACSDLYQSHAGLVRLVVMS